MRAFADAGSDRWRRCRQSTPAGSRGRTKRWARTGGGCSRSARDPTADLADGLRRNHVPPAHSPWWSPLRDSRSRCRVERRVQVERHAEQAIRDEFRSKNLRCAARVAVPYPYPVHERGASTGRGATGSNLQSTPLRGLIRDSLEKAFDEVHFSCGSRGALWWLPLVAGPMRCLSPRPVVSAAAGQS